MTQKEVAINAMRTLDIYAPYINKFIKDGTITLFERFGGYYIDEHNEPELLKKIKEFEAEYECIVYAVTHEFFMFGECYSFLCISKYEEEWKITLENVRDGYAWSYVWNKDDEWCSEFGTVAVRSFGGGIARVA
jgi:hypothetical protein